MEYGKIYSAVTAGEIGLTRGVYGYYADDVYSIKKKLGQHDFMELGKLLYIEDATHRSRFGILPGKVNIAMCYDLFSPICTEGNLEEYKAYCAGKPVVSDTGCTYMRGDGKRCDFLDWNLSLPVRDDYVPFDTIDELIEASGVTAVQQGKGCRPFIWLKHKETTKDCLVTGYEESRQSVVITGLRYPMGDLFAEFTFLDGSPCGKEEGDDDGK